MDSGHTTYTQLEAAHRIERIERRYQILYCIACKIRKRLCPLDHFGPWMRAFAQTTYQVHTFQDLIDLLRMIDCVPLWTEPLYVPKLAESEEDQRLIWSSIGESMPYYLPRPGRTVEVPCGTPIRDIEGLYDARPELISFRDGDAHYVSALTEQLVEIRTVPSMWVAWKRLPPMPESMSWFEVTDRSHQSLVPNTIFLSNIGISVIAQMIAYEVCIRTEYFLLPTEAEVIGWIQKHGFENVTQTITQIHPTEPCNEWFNPWIERYRRLRQCADY